MTSISSSNKGLQQLMFRCLSWLRTHPCLTLRHAYLAPDLSFFPSSRLQSISCRRNSYCMIPDQSWILQTTGKTPKLSIDLESTMACKIELPCTQKCNTSKHEHRRWGFPRALAEGLDYQCKIGHNQTGEQINLASTASSNRYPWSDTTDEMAGCWVATWKNPIQGKNENPHLISKFLAIYCTWDMRKASKKLYESWWFSTFWTPTIYFPS